MRVLEVSSPCNAVSFVLNEPEGIGLHVYVCSELSCVSEGLYGLSSLLACQLCLLRVRVLHYAC